MQKIYLGKNKNKAKRVTLKELLAIAFRELGVENMESTPDRFHDNSASWINLRKLDRKKAVDIVVNFDTDDDNSLKDIDIYVSPVEVNEDKSERLI